MLQALATHINTNFPFLKTKKLLITISGGVDSIVLTHLLYKLQLDISLAHCNFQLRGIESDIDEHFVRELANTLEIPFFTKKFDTKTYAHQQKESTQIAARNLRYAWFEELANQHQFDYILTAHHADDTIETFLINLTRGTGLEGLTGIPKQNGNIIRPLLPFSRQQIVSYAEKEKIQWREDTSNAETKYTRNKIRHLVIPVLKEINPSLLKNFESTLTHLEGSNSIIKDKIQELRFELTEVDGHLTKFNIERMLKLSNPKAYLYELLKDYNFTEWNNVFDLLFSQSGKSIRSKTHVLLRDRAFLILSPINYTKDKKTIYYIENDIGKIKFPIDLKIEDIDKKCQPSKNCILVNKNLVTFPMILRKWQEGDIFYPSGMHGKKKVSKFFKDEKLSIFEKQKAWLLCNNNNQIIWIVGMRQDRRFAVCPSTEHIIRISI